MIAAIENNELRQLLEKGSVHHVFQPIYHLSQWNVHGFEALLRCHDFTPDAIFQKARNQCFLFELDIFSTAQAMQSFFSSPCNSLLFVNVFPSTIIRPLFLETMEQLIRSNSINPQRVYIEINESENAEDFKVFLEHVAELRQMGFRFALDDVGKGFIKLAEITEIKPEIIKIDQYFSANLSTSLNKQKIIQRLMDFCGHDIELILEGLETSEDLAVAKLLGVKLAQGYILGRPKKLSLYDW